MENKPVVLVDMDCTVADLMTPWIDWIEKETGEKPGDQSRYDICSWYPNLEKYEVLGFLNTGGAFRNAAPYPKSKEVINSWLDDDFAVYFVTVVYKDNPHAYREKQEWVAEHFPRLLNNLIIFSSHDKTLLKGDYLVDDHPIHLKGFENTGVPIVYDQPWNQNLPYVRAANWSQVDNIIRGREGQTIGIHTAQDIINKHLE